MSPELRIGRVVQPVPGTPTAYGLTCVTKPPPSGGAAPAPLAAAARPARHPSAPTLVELLMSVLPRSRPEWTAPASREALYPALVRWIRLSSGVLGRNARLR